VLGVSPDSVHRNANFDNKYGLGFPVLADKGSMVAAAYGVWVERSTNGHGATLVGNERTTFVISPEGIVSAVFRNLKPTEHERLVLDALPAN